MYHIELRKFPHNMSRFNLDEHALAAIVGPWVRGEYFELGEHKWNPHEARLTILDGPEIPLDQLTMGRGWRTAQRDAADVTERVLAAARENLRSEQGAGGGQASAGVPATAPGGDAFALGVQMATLLGPDALGLLGAWRAVALDSPGLAPSEALARAEGELRGEG